MIGAPKNFSTLRFEGSFSRIKLKPYFNFLNLPLTVANYQAFRESLNQLYNSPALFSLVTFSKPQKVVSLQIEMSNVHFPTDAVHYNVASVLFHGSRFNLGDVVCFYKTGIIFHSIIQILVSFSNNNCYSESCELVNTFFIVKRLQYHYNRQLNLFIKLGVDDVIEVYRGTDMAGIQAIPVVNNIIVPHSFGRIPGYPIVD